MLANAKYLWGKNIFRTLVYLPSMIPVVVTVMVWQGVLNSNSGWINQILRYLFGIQGPRWFEDEFWVLPAITIMGFWGIGNTMLTMLAGLAQGRSDQDIDSVIERAKLEQKVVSRIRCINQGEGK